MSSWGATGPGGSPEVLAFTVIFEEAFLTSTLTYMAWNMQQLHGDCGAQFEYSLQQEAHFVIRK